MAFSCGDDDGFPGGWAGMDVSLSEDSKKWCIPKLNSLMPVEDSNMGNKGVGPFENSIFIL